jgi:hypothetical protein
MTHDQKEGLSPARAAATVPGPQRHNPSVAAGLVHPDEVIMTDANSVLVADLDAVATHLPRIATELRARTLTSVRQHTIGTLLIELDENLHQYSDAHRPPSPTRTPLKPSSAHDPEPS